MQNAMRIEEYAFGHMTIAGHSYDQDVIVFPDRVIAGWWRREGHSLCLEDVDDVLDSNPDVLIVGTGASGRMSVPDSTRKAIQERGIELKDCTTGEAVELFNQYIESGQHVVGAFHLTC